MKSIDKYEERLKTLQKLNESDVPPMVWDNIERELDGDSPSRKWVFWIFLLALCFISGWYVGSQKISGNQAKIISENIKEGTVLNKGRNLKSVEGNSPLEEITKNINHNTRAGYNDNNKLEVELQSRVDLKEDRFTQSKDMNLNQREQVNEKHAKSGVSNSFTPFQNDDNSHLMQDDKSSHWQTSNPGMSNRLDQNDGLQSNQNRVTNSSNNLNLSAEARTIDLVSLKPIRIMSLENSNNRSWILPSVTECPTFNESNKGNLFYELSFNLGMHKNSLTPLDRTSVFYNLREASESSWYSSGAKVELGTYLSRNFYLKAGLELGMAKDKFYHVNEFLSQVIITYDPVTGVPIDTEVVDGAQVSKGDITFNTIDIPFNLGYIVDKGKWQFGLETGPLLNLSLAAEGRVFNAQEMISTIEDEDVYKSQIGLGWSGALVAKRKIGNQNFLTLRPGFKTYFNPISNDTYTISSRLNLFRIEVGFQHNF